jgi:hypothetical protein
MKVINFHPPISEEFSYINRTGAEIVGIDIFAATVSLCISVHKMPFSSVAKSLRKSYKYCQHVSTVAGYIN